MYFPPQPTVALNQYFSGLTEHAFLTQLGITDPPLIDYLSAMLFRFIRLDDVYRLKDAHGHRIDEVPEMLAEADSLPAEGATRREYLRHIGDCSLFLTGLFPEQVQRRKTGWTRDVFISYVAHGKRAYLIASQFTQQPYQEEAQILRRLGEEFEMCAYGLNHVRKEFEAIATA